MARIFNRLQRLLAWPVRPWVAWSETLVVTLLVMAVGLLPQHADPLGLQSPFPWGWFAPALLALRHGAISALASALILGLAQIGLAPHSLTDERLGLHLLGGLSLTLLLSQFAGLWQNRLRRDGELLSFAQDQLRTLTREHFQLRISHERLEQELVLRPGSLNDAIAALEAALQASINVEPLPQAQHLLHLLAEYCRLDAAAIHLLDADGVPLVKPVALIGRVPTLQTNDPLLCQALASGQLAHVAAADDAARSDWLVVAPLQGAHRRHGPVGVLVVHEMPFLALEPENLQILNLILMAYSDMVDSAKIIAPLRALAPSCPDRFALALHRVWRAYEQAGVDSHLLTLEAPHEPALSAWFDDLVERQRTPDFYWPDAVPGTLRLHILLPLGSRLQAVGLLARLQRSWPSAAAARASDGRLRSRIHRVDKAPTALLTQMHSGGTA